ncbi:MAG: PEPxxWA-CTERM sorting domain-containing protein [Sphingomonadaceae bacterium]|nr:PEPxxWA-CTERM sorting domain-containing protein [Sphingomonadaceae bacterium]
MLGFCVDLPHPIYVNIGSQLAETLHFHVAPLTTDGYGNPLSSGQVRQITGLARLGFTIGHGSAADTATQLAAIQQAIWTVEYPTATFAAAGDNAAAQATYAASFLAQAPRLSGFVRFLSSDDGTIQGQATDVGGVPEPASWALLVAGFGVVGALQRRRSGTLATVAA